MCFYVRCFFIVAICVGNINDIQRTISVGTVSCLLFVMIALKKNINNMVTKQDYSNAVEIYFRSVEKMEKAKAKGKPFGTYDVDKRNASEMSKSIDSELVRYTSVVDLELKKQGVITEQEIEMNELRCKIADGKKIILDLLNCIANNSISPSESLLLLKKATKYIA